jgi:hypothetical protein
MTHIAAAWPTPPYEKPENGMLNGELRYCDFTMLAKSG